MPSIFSLTFMVCYKIKFERSFISFSRDSLSRFTKEFFHTLKVRLYNLVKGYNSFKNFRVKFH